MFLPYIHIMIDSLLQNRTYLHDRHRLSHQQIDRWLGENRSGEFLQEKMRQLEMVHLFLLITDKLKENNIPFVPMKGPLLSLRLYGDPAVRVLHDLDLLIDKKHLEDVIKLMQSEGFEFANNFIWPKEKYRQKLIIRNIHHIGFFNRQNHLLVEIHWVLTSKLAIPVKKVEKIISENLTTTTFAGRNFTVLNKEFELLFLLLHGARHGWSRLKWLADISEYARQEINENLFLQLAGQLKAKRIIVQTNYLLMKYFNTKLPVTREKHIPKQMLRFAEQNIVKTITSERLSSKEIIENFRYQWFLFPGIHYKLIHFSCMFVRPLDVMTNNLPSKTAYYFYRPYSFIKRRVLHG